MKKTIKKMLTAVLAIAMMVTMFAMPVSAGPTDTKTFVLMNDDMSGSIKENLAYGSETNSDFAGFFNGTQWGTGYTTKHLSIANGDTTLVTDTARVAGKETFIMKRPFKNSPVMQEKSTVTITYDVKTAARTPEAATITNRVNDGEADKNMSSYNTKTGVFTHMGFEGKSYTLAENKEYTIAHTFVYNDSNKNHQLTITITDKAGDASITDAGQQVSTATCTVGDFYKKDIKTLADISYRIYSDETPSADGTALLTFQNIKIENIVKGDILNFGDVVYSNDGVQLTGVSQADLDNAVAADSAAGLAGYQWAATDLANKNTSFVYESGDLVSYTTNDNQTDILQKKFTPIKDGDTLKVSFTFKPFDIKGASFSTGEGEISVIKLMGNTTNLWMFGKWGNQYNWGYLFLHEGKDEGHQANYGNGTRNDYNVTITGTGKHNYYETETQTINQQDSVFYPGDRNNDDWNYFKEYNNCVLTATPNADGATYDITMTIKSIKDWRANFVATKNVPKEKILDIDRIAICQTAQETEETQVMRYKDISVETISENPKTALTVGENTVYLPVENVTGHAVDYAIVAAVYETGNAVPKDFAVATFKGNNKPSDKLAIEGVTITNPATEYVVCYVFDKFETVAPHTMPISTAE